jgi:hypothetical protein
MGYRLASWAMGTQEYVFTFIFVFLDHFDVLMLKIIFKKLKKYIILMHFRVKNTLKNNRYYNSKYSLEK